MGAQRTFDLGLVVGHVVVDQLLDSGDQRLFFRGALEHLADAYIPPWPVLRRYSQERFVGREWLADQVDAGMRRCDRGYLLLEAAPGMGKTAFLVHLVRERGYIHHFVELAPGQDGVPSALRSLAAQVTLAWGLRVWPEALQRDTPGAIVGFQQVLAAAAQKRDHLLPHEPIVLVVDGLERGHVPDRLNPLGLPLDVPQGVFFLVSRRSGTAPLTLKAPCHVLRLEGKDERNLADVWIFLMAAAAQDRTARMLKEAGYTRKQFVERLLLVSGGDWGYLRALIDELARGRWRTLDLDVIPESFWLERLLSGRRGQDRADWSDTLLPLLGCLAAVQEPLQSRQLCELAGIVWGSHLEPLLQEEWRPFLEIEHGPPSPRFSLGSGPLRELARGKSPADLGLAGQDGWFERLGTALQRATLEAHSRVADRYLLAWGELDAGLPRLVNADRIGLDGGYGLRHLATHLADALRFEELHRLLALQCKPAVPLTSLRQSASGVVDRLLRRGPDEVPTRWQNLWFAVHERNGQRKAYAADVQRAWHSIERSHHDLRPSQRVALSARYALVTASLRDLPCDLPVPLLLALVEWSEWTPAQALSCARRLSDPAARAAGLAALTPRLPAAQRAAVLGEALAAVRSLTPRARRLEWLARLLPHLPSLERDKVAQEVVSAWSELQGDEAKARILVALVPHVPALARPALVREGLRIGPHWYFDKNLGELLACLPEPERGEWMERALKLALAQKDDGKNAAILAHLAPHLPPPLLNEGLKIARKIRVKEERRWASVTLSAFLPDRAFKRRLSRVLRAAKKLVPARRRAAALSLLLPRLSERRRPQVLGAALDATARIDDAVPRSEALVALLPHLTRSQIISVLREMTTELSAIKDAPQQRYAIAGLAPTLPESQRTDPFAELQRLGDQKPRAQMLVGLLTRGPDSDEKKMSDEALHAVLAADDDFWRVHWLIRLAPHLEDSLLAEALGALQGMRHPEVRMAGLAGIVPFLPEKLLTQAQRAAGDVRVPAERQQALTLLLPYLSASQRARVLDELLAATAAIKGLLGRAEARGALLPFLSREHRAELASELLGVAQRLGDPRARARVLAGTVPYLPELIRWEILRNVLEAGHQIRIPAARARVLTSLAPHLSEPDRTGALYQALAATAAIEGPLQRAAALRSLAPHLPEPLQRKGLEMVRDARSPADHELVPVLLLTALLPHLSESSLGEALEAARDLPQALARAEALALLAPRLVTVPLEPLYALWRETLPILARRSRRDLLMDLGALGPIIEALGGHEAAALICSAIQDVARWWP